MIHILLLFASLLWPSAALAQCNGVFPNNTVCGNITGSGNLPRPTTPSAFLGAAGGTNGQTQYNNAGALGGYTPSGDCTVVPATGVVTCLSTNGVSFNTFVTNAITQGSGVNSVSANYTVLNADIRKTIYTTGTTANQTITVNALSTYANSTFSISVCNSSTHVWTITSADAGSVRLYPTQCNSLKSNGTVLNYTLGFQRYAATTLFVGPSGSCNNANDGLTADSAGQVCSFNTAIVRIQSDLDTHGTAAQVTPSTGTYTENVFFAGVIVGGGDLISINPSGNITVIAASGAVFGVRDLGILSLAGGTHTFSLGCSGATGVQATQFATLDIQSIRIASCTTPFIAIDHGHINVAGTTTFLATLADNTFTASTGGEITLAGTVAGTLTTSNFTMVSTTGGIIFYGSGAVTWSCTCTAATAYTAQLGGGITTGGNLAAIPGTAGGTTISPGWSN